MKRWHSRAAWMALVTASWLAAALPAEEQPAATVSGQPPATAQPPAVKPPLAGENGEEKPLREQTIYIPYSKLREAFEKEGRGVFLPYEQFQELWRQARQSQQPQPDKRPPQAVVLTEIESEATVERDVVVVKAKLKLEVLGKGWHEVVLRLSDAAIRSAQLDGQPARIVYDQQAGYKLLLRNDTPEATRQELVLEYARAFNKSPGLNSVQFAAPQAPINRWRIRIPQKGVKVNIQPLIAATEVPAAEPPMPAAPQPADAVREETVVLAFVGAAPQVQIDWTPKAEGATGLEALATVQMQQEVVLEEGVLRTRARLAYEISRAELSQLLVEIPADQKITGVFDANVRQWQVAAQEGKQIITIQLFEPVKKTQNIAIELERFSDQLVMKEVAVPVVKAVGVGRQQGVVVIRVGEQLRAEPIQRSGLLQLDTAELPPPLSKSPWSFVYRYSALPFELVLRVEKVKPRVRTEELVEVFLEPEQATVGLLAIFDIQQAGVFQLEFDLPAGYVLRQVVGQSVSGAEAASVDSHSLEGENKARLKVNLARKAMGRVGLYVELHKRLEDPNLLSPTGQSSQLDWPLPRTAMSAEGTNGRLVIYAPESLRLNPNKQTGVRVVAFAEAIQGLESQRKDRFPALREVLAFVYTLEPVELTLTVERRKPQVDVRQLLTARIDSGVVKYDAVFHFDVRYSSVKSLRIDVPTPLATEIRNVTPGIREKPIDPRPEDAAEGYTPWSFTGEREFLGEIVIQLTREQKSKELEIGKSADYAIPVLKPMGVDRGWGQIVITKAETLDVNAKSGFTGLRPIDPQHDLMDGVKIADAARAFEFHEDWSLAVTATRYELEDPKHTSIERAVLRMVVTRSDYVSVQALYRVRSTVQRLLVQLPAGAEFDSDPLRLNGRAIPLERGNKDERFIPLVGQNPEQPFVIELRYTVKGDHSRLDFPTFPDQPPIQSKPAMQKIYLIAYLPEEMILLGSRGPWTNQQAYWYEHLNGMSPRDDDRTLVNWVIEALTPQNNPLDSFATDGRAYTFTTLRPTPPPDGSLRLVAWRERWLNLALFGSLALVGLVFVRQAAGWKLGALTVLITMIVLVGVFAPTFAMQVLDFKLIVAIGLIVLLWLVSAAMAYRPRGGGTAHRSSSTDTSSSVEVTSDNSDATSSSPEGMPAKTDNAEQTESPFAGDKQEGNDDAKQGGESHD